METLRYSFSQKGQPSINMYKALREYLYNHDERNYNNYSKPFWLTPQGVKDVLAIGYSRPDYNFFILTVVDTEWEKIKTEKKVFDLIVSFTDDRIRSVKGLTEDLTYLNVYKSVSELRGTLYKLKFSWWRGRYDVVISENGIVAIDTKDLSYPQAALFRIFKNNWKVIFEELGGGISTNHYLNKNCNLAVNSAILNAYS
jgi:hypothetical protein